MKNLYFLFLALCISVVCTAQSKKQQLKKANVKSLTKKTSAKKSISAPVGSKPTTTDSSATKSPIYLGDTKSAESKKSIQDITAEATLDGAGLIGDVKNNTPNIELMSSGIRQLLITASEKTGKSIGVKDGFFLDNSIRISMPDDVSKLTSMLKKIGMTKMVDNIELSMNRAAESATEACVIEVKRAVNEMEISDVMRIVESTDTAATQYLRNNAGDSIARRIKPIVESALRESNATKYWGDAISQYNRLSKSKVNPDLSNYVNGKVIHALFLKIGQQETKLRVNLRDEKGDFIKKLIQ